MKELVEPCPFPDTPLMNVKSYMEKYFVFFPNIIPNLFSMSTE